VIGTRKSKKDRHHKRKNTKGQRKI